MAQIPVFSIFGIATAQRNPSHSARRRRVTSALVGLLTLAAACCMPLAIAAAPPAAGDVYMYRLVNGYNRETVGYIRHEFTDVTTAQGAVVSVTMDQPASGLSHTEIQTQDGQWLRHRLDNHGMPTEYEFTPALPALMPSLTPGKSWSARVSAKVPADGSNRSVRIDGAVLGHERIRVPAGEFDTVKIRRILYPGDTEFFNSETRITEIDWYAPTLGRSVRSEIRSDWLELNCRRHCGRRGDWNVLELTEVRAAAR